MAEAGTSRDRWLRPVLIIAGGIMLLMVAAALIVPALIPWDRVKAQAQEKISATIRHRVTIGAIGLNVFRGVEVRGLRVDNAAGFSRDPLVSTEAAILSYRLLPLLWGQVAIKAVILDKPALLIERAADGRFNFSDMLPEEPAAPAVPAVLPKPEAGQPAPAQPMKLPLGLIVSRAALNHGSLVFHDLKTKQTYAIRNFDLAITHLDLAGMSPATITLSAEVQALGLTIPVKAAADWRFNFSQGHFRLDKLTASVPGLVFTALGTVANAMADPNLDVSGSLNENFAETLVGFGPWFKGKAPKDFAATGSAKITFSAKGPAKNPAALNITLDESTDGKFTLLGSSLPLNSSGHLAMAQGNLDAHARATLPGLSAEISARVRDVAKTMETDANVSARADLAEAARLAPPAQTAAVKGSGTLTLRAAVSGPISEMKKLKISGRMETKNLAAAYQGQDLLAGFNAVMTLVPDRLGLQVLGGRLGGQPVQATLSATGFDFRDPSSLTPEHLKAQVTWSISTPLLDVDALMALMPSSPAPAAGVAVTQLAQTAPAPATVSDLPEPDARRLLPEGLGMQGQAQLGGMKFGSVKLGKMNFRLDIKKRVFTETGSVSGYQGSITDNVRVDFTQSMLGYRVDAQTRNVDLEPLMNDIVDTFVAAKLKKPELLAQLKGKLTGRLSGKLQIAGLGLRTATAKPRLTGQGTFTVLDGRIRKFSFQDNLATWFGSDKFAQDIPFDRTVAEFTLAKQEVNLTKFQADSGPTGDAGDIKLWAQGRLTFGAEFRDFRLRPSLSARAASSLSGQFGAYTEILKDDQGWTTIPAVLNGPINQPNVQPDLEWMKAQAGTYAQRKVKAKAAEAGQKANDLIAQEKGKSGEQIKQDLGQEVEKAKEQMKNLNLQNLFK